MSVNYAEKYSPIVDERFNLAALTTGIVNNEYDWIGVETVNVYSIPTVSMNDYQITGSNRYGSPSELDNAKQELKVAMDRSFTFTIDRKSYDDTMMTMEAGKALARQITEVVVPEVDTYRITKLAAGAKAANVVSGQTTKSNAYETFLAVQEILDNKKVPTAGRIALCTPGFYNLLKLDDAFIKKGDMAQTIALNGFVGECDGVSFIKAPTSYFPEGVNFIITNPIVMPSPIKLNEYKIHNDAPGLSGWLIEGRIRYDAFVLNEKADAIGVSAYVTGYTKVTPVGSENPHTEGWYELNGAVYTLTDDTSVVSGKDYYSHA